MNFVFIAAGLVLLFFGGEGLLKGAVSIARRFNLSNFMIGAVIVGFGTSMPELSVSVKAALDSASGIVMGNVVGSNIANVLLILGICAIICPIVVTDRAVFRDALIVIGVSLLMCIMALTGTISFTFGVALLAALAGYLLFAYRQDRKKSAADREETLHHIQEDTEGEVPLPFGRAVVYTVAGLVLLGVGATLLVEGATAIARGFGIPESIIGLTLVAIGTSLPELATGAVAAWRKHTDIIIGNILGSCLFNILCILGISAMISPVEVAPNIAASDMWVMLATAILLALVLKSGHRLSRGEGVFMLCLYIGYSGWLYVQTV